MTKKRSYACKDADMLFTAEFIADNLKANLNALSHIRKQWTDGYTNDLGARVKYATIKYLSNDSQKTLRNATAKVMSILDNSIKSLIFFKTQLCIDFKNDKAKRDEILKTLGFTKFFKKASSKNQNALLQLFLAFKENLTEDIRVTLTSKGFSDSELDEIIDLADIFKDANTHQENTKAYIKQFSQEKRNVLNALADEIKGICKLVTLKIDKDDSLKDIFNFKKVAAQMSKNRKTKAKDNIDVTNNKNENQEDTIQ